MVTICYGVQSASGFRSFSRYKDAVSAFKSTRKTRQWCKLIKYWYDGGRWPKNSVVLEIYQ